MRKIFLRKRKESKREKGDGSKTMPSGDNIVFLTGLGKGKLDKDEHTLGDGRIRG